MTSIIDIKGRGSGLPCASTERRIARGALWACRSRWWAWVGATAVAGVWVYEGLWCKVLGGRPDQMAVMGGALGVGGERARLVLVALGVAEVALAAAVLVGVAWRRLGVWAAAAQTGLLVVMNTGGILMAREAIDEPVGMVLNNVVLVVLVWLLALNREAS